MTILVTGATGQLGRLVIDHLIARGVDPATIRAAGRNPDKLAEFASRGIQTAVIDFEVPGTLVPAFAGVDALLFVSGSEVGKRMPQHRNAIDAAVAAGVGRIVYTSAPHADTTELPVAPEHKATEALLAASGLPVTVLRNNWYTENYVAPLEQARETGTVVSSAGDGRIGSATRNDYADAAAVVLSTPGHEGKVYELAGDVAWSFDDLAAAFSEIIGSEVVYTPVEPEEYARILRDAGLDEGTVGFVVALDQATRDGALADVTGDLSALIGHPTTSLVDGLRAAIA
ncbi:SDR family oxidoreductase [Diaminobutyricibacter tongyongensis]|uniref:SDR family oxidoreductase n=1 Tax=Leifsonia tongyongensis TaxID=1268043 RepID=A0A6L9Y0S2_9MICO|nr:SDR family oxidoreductase [Diaminobutyricibacter tongyongensis]NEN07240.1 SDR family oxidoreductase [Diaminobutyricibacter tongyongensis]